MSMGLHTSLLLLSYYLHDFFASLPDFFHQERYFSDSFRSEPLFKVGFLSWTLLFTLCSLLHVLGHFFFLSFIECWHGGCLALEQDIQAVFAAAVEEAEMLKHLLQRPAA